MAYSRTKLARYIVDHIDTPDVAEKIAAFLIQSGKTADLDSLMREVQELRAVEGGVVELTARTAYPLGADEKAQIEAVIGKQYPKTREVIMHEVHDASVVGGASLSLAQASLDVTIKNKLNRLRESIS